MDAFERDVENTISAKFIIYHIPLKSEKQETPIGKVWVFLFGSRISAGLCLPSSACGEVFAPLDGLQGQILLTKFFDVFQFGFVLVHVAFFV